MGTWGLGTFENDVACDWAFALEDAQGLELVRSTLQRAVDDADFLDADAACEALAASEVVARLKGHWGIRDAHTEPVDRWVEAHPGEPPIDLVALATAAIDRVVAEPSELLELWNESQELEAWKTSVDDLRRRVSD